MNVTLRGSLGARGAFLACMLIGLGMILGGCTSVAVREAPLPPSGLPGPEQFVGALGQGSEEPAAEEESATTPILALAPSHLVFTPETRELFFTVTNQGVGTLNWELGVEANPAWLSVTPRVGSLGPGESSLIAVTVDRQNLATGLHIALVYLTALGMYDVEDWYATLPVTVDVPPEYHGPIGLALWVEKIDGKAVTINGVVGSADGTITRVRWLWGDGTLHDSTLHDSWFPATHVYKDEGTYPVQVTAYSASGRERTTTFRITVGEKSQTAALTGRWSGTLSYDHWRGQWLTGDYYFTAQLAHAGTSVTGTMYGIPGQGTYQNGQFEFSFGVGQWVYTVAGVYDPLADKIVGSWLVDGERAGAMVLYR